MRQTKPGANAATAADCVTASSILPVAEYAKNRPVKCDLTWEATILKDGRTVFNLGGNKYRLVVWINYDYATIYTRFIGTHARYDQIDAQTI